VKPYVLGTIFARGGSKGIPRKNLKLLAGKPLIAYAIETARGCKLLDRLIVSTDDHEIAEVAKQYGAEVPFLRPAELARDDSPEWLAWQHAIHTLEVAPGAPKIDVLVSVPTTSPLRSVQDLEACIQLLLESDADAVITVTPTNRNPYFNMVVLDKDGCARVAVAAEKVLHRRQDAPPVYDMTTVAYAVRAQFVTQERELFAGRVKAVVVPPERAIDIDTELDLKIAQFLLTEGLTKQ
jgi:N-acylneuraminate cytidylyltransferase